MRIRKNTVSSLSFRGLAAAMLLPCLLSLAVSGCVSQSMRVYGTPAVLGAKGVRVRDALKDAKKYDGQALLVHGTIVDVDQEAGAWLILADSKTPEEKDPEKTLRVVRESPRIHFPRNAAGHRAKVLGTARIYTTESGGTSLALTAIGIGIHDPSDLERPGALDAPSESN